jgi:hypothetical protein
MDNLFIDLGGHHLLGDDLLKLQEYCQNPLYAFAQATGESFIALSGVNITVAGSVISWTDGWIYMSGEIFKVDAGSAAFPANDTFQVLATNDVAGLQVYENTVSVNTYKLRKATISGNLGGATSVGSLKRFKDFLVPAYKAWVQFSNIARGTWYAVVSTGGTAGGFRLNRIDELVFRGIVRIISYTAPDNIVLTIPWGTTVSGLSLPFGPAEEIYLSAEGKVGGMRTKLDFILRTNGDLEILGRSAGQQIDISLDTIRIAAQ